MRTVAKYALIAFIAFALGALASSKIFDNREPEIVVQVDTMWLEKQDSTGLVIATQEKVEVAPVVLTLPEGTTLPTGEVITEPVEVETQEYTGTEELENGTIHWKIYADELLAYDFNLVTEEKIITKTITKTLPAKSRLYLGARAGLNWRSKYPQQGGLSLMYNRRQKWAASIDVMHDFSGLLPATDATTVGFTVYIGL